MTIAQYVSNICILYTLQHLTIAYLTAGLSKISNHLDFPVAADSVRGTFWNTLWWLPDLCQHLSSTFVIIRHHSSQRTRHCQAKGLRPWLHRDTECSTLFVCLFQSVIEFRPHFTKSFFHSGLDHSQVTAFAFFLISKVPLSDITMASLLSFSAMLWKKQRLSMSFCVASGEGVCACHVPLSCASVMCLCHAPLSCA